MPSNRSRCWHQSFDSGLTRRAQHTSFSGFHSILDELLSPAYVRCSWSMCCWPMTIDERTRERAWERRRWRNLKLKNRMQFHENGFIFASISSITRQPAQFQFRKSSALMQCNCVLALLNASSLQCTAVVTNCNTQWTSIALIQLAISSILALNLIKFLTIFQLIRRRVWTHSPPIPSPPCLLRCSGCVCIVDFVLKCLSVDKS